MLKNKVDSCGCVFQGASKALIIPCREHVSMQDLDNWYPQYRVHPPFREKKAPEVLGRRSCE